MKSRNHGGSGSRTEITPIHTGRRAGFAADERGFVLVGVAIAFVLLLTLAGAGIVHSTNRTVTTGNATIYGSLWTGHLRIRVGGSAIVRYCRACIQLVDGMDNVGTTPRPMRVVSWSEVL